MSQTPSLPDYADVANALSDAKSPFQPATVHGLLCGYLSAGNNSPQWLHHVLGKSKSRAAIASLETLYETSYHQISDFSFEFTLLLPDDDEDINQRTEALGLWCQGYLTGLEQSQVPITGREPSDVTEALENFIEIAQVNFGDINTNEDDETAYFELVEYVRLAVLMIFQELTPTQPPANGDDNTSLH